MRVDGTTRLLGLTVCWLLLAGTARLAQAQEPTVEPEALERAGEAEGEARPGSAAAPSDQTPADADEQAGEAGELSEPAPHVLEGVKIMSITILCDLPRCQDPDEMSRLISLSGLVPGTDFSAEKAAAAEYFLGEIGLFARDSIEVVATETPAGGVSVTVETLSLQRIREVEIEAGSTLDSEVERRLFMRPGSVYNQSQAPTQENAIEQFFEERGYRNTDCQIFARKVEGEPHLVDLEVRVLRGARLDIDRIYIKGNEAFSYATLQNEMLDEFGFFRTYEQDAYDNGLDAILRRYREEGYIRARFVTEEARAFGERVNIYLEIREGGRWEFAFEGNRDFSDSDLEERLPFVETGYIDSEEIAASAEELAALYRTSGYYFVEVEPREIPLGNQRTRVVYAIEEGPVAEIREVSFAGNASIPSEELLELMTTREYGVLASGGFLQDPQLQADVRNLEAYYHARGYLSARVPRWTVVAENDRTELYITVFIDEGPLTRVSEVRFEGNEVVSSGELAESVQMSAGDPFSPEQLTADQGNILGRYRSRGYQPDVPRTVCLVRGEPVPCRAPRYPASCRPDQPPVCSEVTHGERLLRECIRVPETFGCQLSDGILGDEVAVVHHIQEGDLVRVGEIFVVGHYVTDEDVIRAEVPMRSEDPFNYARVIEAQANLSRLALFNSVTVRAIGVGRDSPYRRDRAAIVVTVEEGSYRFVEVRVALAGQNTVTAQTRFVLGTEAGYVDRNFLGDAVEFRTGGSFEFDLIGAGRIAEGEFIAGAEVALFDPRFDLFDTLAEPVEAEFSLNGLYDLLSVPQNRMELGGTMEAREEIVENLTFSLGFGLTYARSRFVPSEEDFEDTFILQVSPAVVWNTSSNVIDPDDGFRLEGRLDIADFFERYIRVQTSFSHYLRLRRHFVVASHLRLGFGIPGISTYIDPGVRSDEALVLPPTERFQLGGVAGLRGFPDSSLGPLDENGVPTFGDVVMSGTLELRFPILPDFGPGPIRGAYFLEAGQLTTGFSDVELDAFRYTTGIGVRWVAVGLVPIHFDYGLVLDRRPGEAIGGLQFNVGYPF